MNDRICGFTHLQFEALLTAARQSPNPCDFIVLVPRPLAVGRAIDQAIGSRTSGPILLNTRGSRMDRHAATGRVVHPGNPWRGLC